MNGIQQYNPSSSNTIDDRLYSLPFDIITNIITFLLQAVRVECLKVSRLWRAQILACAKAWSILSLENGEQHDPLTELAYDISKHVMDLRMTTTSETVCSQFLKQLRAGSFTRVQSLKIAVNIAVNKCRLTIDPFFFFFLIKEAGNKRNASLIKE